ncbi:MAG: prepilin peptidase [Rickettsiales bacterium]|jgi:hypothetical protein|nr:prepilin peptidase [Rickettsiales bacterium]
MLELILVTVFGAIFGSYATLFAYRLPLNESVFGRYFGPKSRCPKCSSIIKTRDLIPLINWLITFGKCRNCNIKIPRIHLFVELSTVIGFILSYLVFGFNETFILNAIFITCLVIITATDYSHQIFPFQILCLMSTIAVAIRTIQDQSINNIIFNIAFAIILISILWKIIKVEIDKKHEKITTIFTKINLSKQQFFDYIKLILIASLILPLVSFALYFAISIIAIFSLQFIRIIFKKFYTKNKEKNINYKYSLGYIFTFTLLIFLIIKI